MDEYSGRRTSSGFVFSRKGSSLALRDSAESSKDGDVQVCSRVGCSSRLTQPKGAQSGSFGKAKALKVPLYSSARGKDIIGSSSRTPFTVSASRRSFSDQNKKSPSHVETDSQTSSLQDEPEEVSEPISTSGKAQMRVHPELEDDEPGEGTSPDIGTSSSGPTNRLLKGKIHNVGLRRLDSQASSSSLLFRHSNQGRRTSANASRYSLRNLGCNLVSDVVPSGCSSSTEISLGRKRDIGRKRFGEPESSSSARGKKMSGLMLDDTRNDNPSRGISISDSRRTRNLNASGENDATSIRTRWSTSRTRLSNQESRNSLPMIESPLLNPPSSQPDMSLDAIGSSFEDHFNAHTPPSRASSFIRPGSGSELPRPSRLGSANESGFAHSFMSRDTFRQFNLDGIAEMLLTLECIGQEEEPSYEQLLVLETNLFLGGLALHDQHRDMRLDIDNMPYEELLALEERIGTVTTAVPEEALTKCLRKGIYHETIDYRGEECDIKCSICQEEYTEGEEIGSLGCDHRYHIECINQWLRLKNWCPICKAYVEPSPSSSSLH